MTFYYKTILIFGIQQKQFNEFIKLVLTQNRELEIISNNFDVVKFNDWLNQMNFTITEPHRSGMRRNNNTLYEYIIRIITSNKHRKIY